MQDAAIAIVGQLIFGIDPACKLHFFGAAIGKSNGCVERLLRLNRFQAPNRDLFRTAMYKIGLAFETCCQNSGSMEIE